MKRFFSSKVRTVLVIAVVLAAALTVIGNLTGSTPLDGVVKGLLTPISTAASHLKNGAAQLYSYLFRYEALAAENADLKEQLAQISNDARKLDAMTRENARLRAALELQQDHEDYKLVDAYIIDRDSRDWASTFTINRGSASGLAEGMCVVTENGEVVGLITSVGSNYAVVTTVLDSSLEVSATIASTGYNGMVRGRLHRRSGRLSADGLSAHLCRYPQSGPGGYLRLHRVPPGSGAGAHHRRRLRRHRRCQVCGAGACGERFQY